MGFSIGSAFFQGGGRGRRCWDWRWRSGQEKRKRRSGGRDWSASRGMMGSDYLLALAGAVDQSRREDLVVQQGGWYVHASTFSSCEPESATR